MAVKLKEVLKKDLVRDKVDPTVKVDDMARPCMPISGTLCSPKNWLRMP